MKKGFTIIEIIITIGIISVVTVVSLAYFNNFSENRKLDMEANKILDVLELIKKKSVSAEILDEACTDFTGYNAVFTAGGVTVNFCCEDVCDTVMMDYPMSNFDSVKTVIRNGSAVSFPAAIQFTPVLAKIKDAGSYRIILANTHLSACKNLTITPLGVIEITTSTSCL